MDDAQELLLQSAEQGNTAGLQTSLQHGAVVDKVARGERGALHLASAGGHLETVKVLLHYQADTGIRSYQEGDHGGTALHLATDGGHDQVMEALLGAGADTEARDDKGKKPVHTAAYKGQLPALEVLQRHNCNISAQSHARSTALHYAAAYGNLEVVRWLVRAGVKHDIKDKSGRLPKDVAKQQGHTDVQTFLKDHAARRREMTTEVASSRGSSFRLTKKRRSLSVSSLFKGKTSASYDLSSSRRQDDPPSPSFDHSIRKGSSPDPAASEISSIRVSPIPAVDTNAIRKVEDWRARGIEATSLVVGGESAIGGYDRSTPFSPASPFQHSTPSTPVPLSTPFSPASPYQHATTPVSHSTPVPLSIPSSPHLPLSPSSPLSPASPYTHTSPYSPSAPDPAFTFAQEEQEIHLRRKELEIYELRIRTRQMEHKMEEARKWGPDTERLREEQRTWEEKEKKWEGEVKAAREETQKEVGEEIKRQEDTKVQMSREHQEEKLALEQQVYSLSLQIQQYHEKQEQQARVEAELRGADKARQSALALSEENLAHLTQQLEESRKDLAQLQARAKVLQEGTERESDTISQLNSQLKTLADKLTQSEEARLTAEAQEEEESDTISQLNNQFKTLADRLTQSEEARLTAEDQLEEMESESVREIIQLKQQLQEEEDSSQQTITALKEELQRRAKRREEETQQREGQEREVDQLTITELRTQVHSLSERLESRIQDLLIAETRQRKQEAQSETIIMTLKQQIKVLQQKQEHQQQRLVNEKCQAEDADRKHDKKMVPPDHKILPQLQKLVARLEMEKRELTKALEAVNKENQEARGATPEGNRTREREAIQQEVNAKLEVWRRDLLKEREANQSQLKEVTEKLENERRVWTKTLNITQRRLKESIEELETGRKQWAKKKEGIQKQLQSVRHETERKDCQGKKMHEVSATFSIERKKLEAEKENQLMTVDGRLSAARKEVQETQQSHNDITQLIEELVEAKQDKGGGLLHPQPHQGHWKGESSPDLVVSAVGASATGPPQPQHQAGTPSGLPNLGNTGYINSVVQCLFSVASLKKYFISDVFRLDMNLGNKSKGRVAEAVAKVMVALLSDDTATFTRHLTHLKGVLEGVDKEFSGWEQRDAHDLLTVLLAALHHDLLKAGGSSVIQESTQWEQESVISCEVYGEITRTREPFSNLSLTVPHHRISLQAAIARYYRQQSVEWDCPHCRRSHLCRHQTAITRLPPVLIIHLSRNSQTPTTNKARVDFPAENLTLKQHLQEGGGHSPWYELVGVVNHHGTLNSGHYTASCRSHSDLTWRLYDDHQVADTSLQRVLAETDAYLLFYHMVK